MSAAELFDLTDKVAVITGGAGGIGVVYAEALAAKGHQVVGVAVDVRSEESTAAMAQAAVDAFGGIDILINNAAIMVDLPPYGLADIPVAEWDRVIDVNFRGPLLCTQAVLPAMEARGGGRSA